MVAKLKKAATKPAPKRLRKVKTGRPLFKPTENQRAIVTHCVGFGMSEDEICKLIWHEKSQKPITGKTLRRAFRRELDIGLAHVKAQVIQSLFKKATGNGPQSVTAAIWFTKARMGWTEKVIEEHVGAGGGAIEHRHTHSRIDAAKLAGLSDQQLTSLYAEEVGAVAPARKQSNGSAH